LEASYAHSGCTQQLNFKALGIYKQEEIYLICGLSGCGFNPVRYPKNSPKKQTGLQKITLGADHVKYMCSWSDHPLKIDRDRSENFIHQASCLILGLRNIVNKIAREWPSMPAYTAIFSS